MFLCRWELLYFVTWFCTTGRVFCCCFCNENPTKLQHFSKAK